VERSIELTDRDRQVLEALVRCYIDTGEAVSSLWLAARGRFGVSSATVRNILGRLEELGFVRQPHTSAGRVPTDLGYRVHVDKLLQSYRPGRTASEIVARLRLAGTVDDVLSDASQELSRSSHHVGFALVPAATSVRLNHIDFVPLAAQRVLVVFVAAGGQITHKVIETEEEYQPAELEQASNYVNAEFAGLTLAEIRDAILARVQQERMLYDELMARALRLAQTSFEGMIPESVFIVQGASLLLDELATDALRSSDEQATAFETLRELLKMIDEKHRLVRLLTEYLEQPGVTILIGSENAAPELGAFSIITSRYDAAGRPGVLGVIGPTRMRYSRAISLVDAIARAISRQHDDEN
jgi:heat-inducible transcriptional repressor